MDKRKAINRNFGVCLAVSIALTIFGLIFMMMAGDQRSIYGIVNYVDNTLKLTGEILLGIGIFAIAGSILYRYVAISKLEGRPLFQASEAAAPVKEESNPAEELRKLKALYEEKAITKEEYDEQRKKVLERM